MFALSLFLMSSQSLMSFEYFTAIITLETLTFFVMIIYMNLQLLGF